MITIWKLKKLKYCLTKKNKKILLINLKLKLYAQRDPSTYIPPAAPADDSAKDVAAAGKGQKVPSPQKVDTTGGVSPEAAQ